MAKVYQERAHRVLRFFAVGTTVAGIDFSLVWLLHFTLPPMVAVSLAYLAGVSCHFLLNKKWVFRCRRDDYVRQLFQYGVNVAACWLVTLVAVHFALATFTHSVMVAKLCALPFSTSLGFCIMQLWVFRGRSAVAQGSAPRSSGMIRRSV